MEELISKITSMIEDIQPYVEFDNETKLLDEEVLDSMSVLLLVQELEEEFEITIDIEEVKGENFENVPTIVNLVQSKIKVQAG